MDNGLAVVFGALMMLFIIIFGVMAKTGGHFTF